MKERAKILVGIGAGVVVVGIATAIAARLLFAGSARVVTFPGSLVEGGPQIVKEYALANFDRIDGGDAFQLAVSEAPTYQVQLRTLRSLESQLDVYVEGETLHIGLRPGVVTARVGLYRAIVTMPKLSAIRTSGAAKVSFSGFSGDELTVASSGAAKIEGAGRGYRRLRVDSSGASVIGLQDLPVTDARVRSSGAGVVRLTMQGGELSGELSGAVRLVYSGSVNRVDVRASGASVVTRR